MDVLNFVHNFYSFYVPSLGFISNFIYITRDFTLFLSFGCFAVIPGTFEDNEIDFCVFKA